MKTPFILFTLYPLFSCSIILAQAPSIQWEKSYGGSSVDVAYSVQQTADGGFIVAGQSASNNIDISGNHGGGDYWIVKLDANGNLVWQKCLGGEDDDAAYSIQQTSDGGYIVAGISLSQGGEITGNHGNYDYWIVKLDILGNLSWQKSFGGTSNDEAYSIQQTTDGGYIVAGLSTSLDYDVIGNHGHSDYWIVKLDSIGNLLWQKCLGGTDYDEAGSCEQTSDGGFIIAGYSPSINGDVTGNHGDDDCWIVKLDTAGNIEWENSLGGTGLDIACSIQQTTDGGFVIAGFSGSNDGDVSGNHGSIDNWIMKLDASGHIVWQKSLGGSHYDAAFSVEQTSDGGFVVCGKTLSNDAQVTGNHGSYDYWIVKLDTLGSFMWQICTGGSTDEYAQSIKQTTGDGFIIAGFSSSNDGDITENHGSADYWVVKLAFPISTGVPQFENNAVFLYPNPVQTELTINFTAPVGEVSISVLDVHGRKIAMPSSNFKSPDAIGTGQSPNSVQLSTTSLPDGFYTLQIIDSKSGKIEVGTFVKVK